MRSRSSLKGEAPTAGEGCRGFISGRSLESVQIGKPIISHIFPVYTTPKPTSGIHKSGLPDVMYVDKRGGWVTAENRERSVVSRDRCCKQAAGRHVGSTRQAPAASSRHDRVACGCLSTGNTLSLSLKQFHLIVTIISRLILSEICEVVRALSSITVKAQNLKISRVKRKFGPNVSRENVIDSDSRSIFFCYSTRFTLISAFLKNLISQFAPFPRLVEVRRAFDFVDVHDRPLFDRRSSTLSTVIPMSSNSFFYSHRFSFETHIYRKFMDLSAHLRTLMHIDTH